ncbi:MAG TPA: hypothetical protein VOA87_03665 [Thermoanaerobaculia bacterium]|nr:hypothetical protein [Thermoanaerobaculia bacterium]
MLRETVIEWTQQWLEEGREEGLQKGREEGQQQGEARLLVRLLELKFGPLCDHDRERIASASADLLLLWGERVLTAGSLGEVFADGG